MICDAVSEQWIDNFFDEYQEILPKVGTVISYVHLSRFIQPYVDLSNTVTEQPVFLPSIFQFYVTKMKVSKITWFWIISNPSVVFLNNLLSSFILTVYDYHINSYVCFCELLWMKYETLCYYTKGTVF